MKTEASADFLPYYMAELGFLRVAGRDFALRYPRVAAQLELSSELSHDPQIQRLIESFAFLTARLQRGYDLQFPEIPEALLSVLYPQLVAPVPSMAIAAFVADPEQSRSVSGVTVPAGTALFAEADPPATHAAGDRTCRFRTAYATTLWPVEVADAALEHSRGYAALDAVPRAQRVVRIRLRCLGHRRFAEFAPPALRFYLSANSAGRAEIFELLMAHGCGVAVAPVPEGDAPPEARLIEAAGLRTVGLGADEAILPSPPMSHQAYGLLQEYFAFPDKFLFIEVTGLPPSAFGAGTQADLLLLLDSPPQGLVVVNDATFVLGCTPIVNLFTRVAEPIRVDQTKLEYRLVADSRRESTTEIHSIQKVTRASADAARAGSVRPLFSFRHADGLDDNRVMYWARRRPAANPGLEGSELVLSFVDPDLNPDLPATDMVFAHVLCTNRGSGQYVPAGRPMDLEVDLPVRAVTCLTRPTRQVPPPATGGMLWRLVSHLSTNHLPLTGGEDGAAALREVLMLYCPRNEAGPARRIAGLTRVSSRRAVRRIGDDAWRGFCRGFDIDLEYDDRAFAGESAYMLGLVLSRFFGLHAGINAFARLSMSSPQREETWRWPPVTGDAILL